MEASVEIPALTSALLCSLTRESKGSCLISLGLSFPRDVGEALEMFWGGGGGRGGRRDLRSCRQTGQVFRDAPWAAARTLACVCWCARWPAAQHEAGPGLGKEELLEGFLKDRRWGRGASTQI